MKTTKLKTAVNNRYIFKLKDLSYHTKCILSKIANDFLCKGELDWDYLEENIFGVWSDDIIMTALNELADCDIMIINVSCDEDKEEYEECDEEMKDKIMFNPEFLNKVLPSLNECSCCSEVVRFNVIYN